MTPLFSSTARLLALLLLVCCHYLWLVSAAQRVVAAANGILERNLVLDDGNLVLTLTANIDAGTLTVAMTYADTVWIGFAFSNTDSFMVPGSMAVILEPDNGPGVPQVYSLNARTVSGLVLQEYSSLTESGWLQSDTHTSMTFTKPLVQDGFPTVSLTETNHFLYAVGASNTLGFHALRAAIDVSFAETDDAPTPAPSREADTVNECNLLTWILQFLLGWLGFQFCDL